MNSGRPHPYPLPEGEGENTPIDRLRITVAGQSMSLRQATLRILRKPFLNFAEEVLLLGFVKASEEKKLSVRDIEYAVSNWATSRGSDSMNYLKGIVNRIIDENNRQKLVHRTPTSKPLPEVVLEADEAPRFLQWLRDRHYRGYVAARGDETAFQAEEIHAWYKRFREEAVKEEQGG